MIPSGFNDEINKTCDVTLRPVSGDDLPFLLSLYKSSRESELSLIPWDDQQKDLFTRMQFEAQSSHYEQEHPAATHCVIESRDEAVGRIYIDFATNEIELMDLIIEQGSRNKGLGNCIVRAVQNEAMRTEKKILIYLTLQDQALQFFERLGFKAIDDNGQLHVKFEWSSAVPATH